MRGGLRRAALAAGTVLLAVTTSGCGQRPGSGGVTPVAAPSLTASASAAAGASAQPSSRVIAEGFGAAAKPKPTTTKSKPPKPTRKPPVEKVLPPPPPPPADPAECTKPKYVGDQASRAQVKDALTDAAGRTYWPNSASSIKVPVNLVKATAWQESGWQSNIIACDGGVGLMQVMPDTADFVNRRFDKSYDIDDYRDNAILGANYLAWLIKYFGDVYFDGDYTLYTNDDCASHTTPCLINAVIASYNYGFGAVDTDDGIVIPNPRYVENIRALMSNCECLDF